MELTIKQWNAGDAGKYMFVRDCESVGGTYCVVGDMGVAPSYVGHFVNHEADVVFVGYSKDGVPRAFTMGKHSDGMLYLGIICGMQGTGSTMLLHFLKYADAEGFNVSLSAMPNVLSYYTRPEFGFEFRKSCSADAEVVDATAIAGKKPPLTLKGISDDPVFGPFLEELHTRGFNVFKGGACKRPTLTSNSIIRNHCSSDGYAMARCPLRGVKSMPTSARPTSAARLISTATLTATATTSKKDKKTFAKPKPRSPRSPSSSKPARTTASKTRTPSSADSPAGAGTKRRRSSRWSRGEIDLKNVLNVGRLRSGSKSR